VAKIVLYTTPYCPYCVMAIRLFDQKGVTYENIDVSGDQEKRRWLLETTGQRTVPQIFIDDKSYGGFTDVAAIDRQGQLDELLGLAEQ